MQKARRSNVTSVDEPNAFRIAPAPQNFESSNPSHRDGQHTFVSDNTPTSQAVFPRSLPDFTQPYHHPAEPASWLAAPDLSSPGFSAHDFLQCVLSERFEAARPSHIPVLENSFDADAALAALDTVESALRKRRDIARREEEVARDELRKSLHMSAKKRDQLVRTADAVSGSVSSLAEVGRQATESLNTDVVALKAAAETLASLQDARDLVSLLTVEDCELDAVRVSKLLAKARQHLEDGSLSELLPDDDMAVAREEMEKCQSELSFSVHAWMRSAVDTGQPHVVKECAQAADELNSSQSFIDSYISHVFAFDQAESGVSLMDIRIREKAFDDLERFRSACWEITDAVSEIIPTICESFPKPSKPLANVIRVLSERKVLTAAEITLRTSRERVQENANTLLETSSTSSSVASLPRSLADRLGSYIASDAKENCREVTGRVSAQRREFLRVCNEVFKGLTVLKSELLSRCKMPGVADVKMEFVNGSDPYKKFADHWLPEYLKCEKKWIDEQLGNAFSDISRIEAHAPRLAPREASNANVYHRYRAFYSHISSQYQQMTRQAVESTYESLCRLGSVLGCFSTLPSSSTGSDAEDVTSRESGCRPLYVDGVDEQARDSSPPRLAPDEQDEFEEIEDKYTDSSHPVIPEEKNVPREVLDGLVMCYLANAETILQAATHLLPVSDVDATMQELWVSGASPLTAYLQAIEVLSRSNEMLEEFLLTLELVDRLSDAPGPAMPSEGEVDLRIPQETREMLHRELTSGLNDLEVEAQSGVRSAVASVRARLVAMLSTSEVKSGYSRLACSDTYTEGVSPADSTTKLGLDIEPSAAFMGASTFVEQQLQSAVASACDGNREFVVSELAEITRDAVLECWCSCDGPIPFSGALQLVADGKAMMRVFQSHQEATAVVECLLSVGQLFLEGSEGLWQCVESKSLAGLETATLVELLKKREDCLTRRVMKMCESLSSQL